MHRVSSLNLFSTTNHQTNCPKSHLPKRNPVKSRQYSLHFKLSSGYLFFWTTPNLANTFIYNCYRQLPQFPPDLFPSTLLLQVSTADHWTLATTTDCWCQPQKLLRGCATSYRIRIDKPRPTNSIFIVTLCQAHNWIKQ